MEWMPLIEWAADHQFVMFGLAILLCFTVELLLDIRYLPEWLYVKFGWCWTVRRHRRDWKGICVDCKKPRPPYRPDRDSVW